MSMLPDTSGHRPSLGSAQNVQAHDSPAPVSAIMAGPSDWEHFTPTDYARTDTPLHDFKSFSMHAPSQPPRAQELPQHTTPVAGKLPSFPLTQSSQHEFSQNMSVPVVGTSDQPYPSKPHEPHAIEAQKVQKQESDSTHGPAVISGAHEDAQRRGTIDSIIQARSKPISTGENWKGEAPQRATNDDRPVSPPSLIHSPSPTLATIYQEPAHQPVQQAVPATTTGGIYQDLDPEFHSSLARYVNMLRRESAASTDEEKFKIFESFMTREFGIRRILYGIETEGLIQTGKSPSRIMTPPSATNQAKDVDPESNSAELQLTKTTSSIKRKPLRSPSAEPTATDEAAKTEIPSDSPQTSKSTSQTRRASEAINTNASSLISNAPTQTSPQPQIGGNQGPEASTAEADTQHPLIDMSSGEHRLLEVGKASSKEVFPHANSENHVDERDASSDSRGFSETKAEPPTLKNDSSQPVEPASPKGIDQKESQQQDEDAAYSPGGRPRLGGCGAPESRLAQIIAPIKVGLPDSKVPERVSSPSENAPMVIADYAMIHSPSENAPMPVEDSDIRTNSNVGAPAGSIKFEPTRPVYTPYKYNEEASRRGTPVQAPDRPALEEYSSLRTHAAGGGRLLGHEIPERPVTAPLDSTNALQAEQQDSFLGLLRSQSRLRRPKSAAAMSRSGTPTVMDPITEALKALRSVISPNFPPDGSTHEKTKSIRTAVDTCPDDFGFIRESVISWDKKNREVRAQHDKERDRRQEESEHRFDELFDANEISYADLNTAEADFKIAEAERKYREDQQELQFFIDSVFTPVSERLQQEISRLTVQYTSATELLQTQSESISHHFKPDSNRVPMAGAMELVLHIFQKLEVRYQKLAEARFERERRRKKLELTVLYTNGNTAGVKKLEQEFNEAEKLQVLQESQNKDTRANQLMDFFDRATLRGLADNQTYMDDLLSKIKKLKEALPSDSQNLPRSLYEGDGTGKTLRSAQDVLDVILTDSRSILSLSNSADQILNNADYAVSVAQARAGQEDKSMFRKLEEDKAKEDAKLAEEMANRMDSMAKAPAEATALIQDILAKVGDDDQHQQRLKRALEEAKKRNAAKESQVPT